MELSHRYQANKIPPKMKKQAILSVESQERITSLLRYG